MGAAVCRNIYIGVESTLLKSQVMVVEKNSVDSFSPGVEIAVVRDMEGGLLLVCSASGKYDLLDDLYHGDDVFGLKIAWQKMHKFQKKLYRNKTE